MRSEAEIRRKLAQLKKVLDKKPTFWNVLRFQVYEACFNWVLKEK